MSMDEKDLKFDRKKHVCYSPKAKGIIQTRLLARYPKSKAEKLWEKIQLQYIDFLKDLPYLGGKNNPHNATAGTYDCIALFAYYEVLERKPSIEEIYEMNNEMLLPSFKILGRIVNLNHQLWQRILNLAFTATAKRDAKDAAQGVMGYLMNCAPYDKESGICYQFKRCPIAEFAKAHGYLSIMPAICNGDYPVMELLHGKLIRRHTCANGDVCDYRIVGDKNSAASEHMRKTDEKGYWYND